MAEVNDLDVVVPAPKRVRFGGTEYDVPADMPMEIFLRVNAAGRIKDDEGNDDQGAQILALGDAICDLFIWELEDHITPEQEQEIRANVNKTLRRRGVRYCFTLIGNIYKDDDEEKDNPPVQAPQDGDSNGTRSSTTSQSPTTPSLAATEPLGS